LHGRQQLVVIPGLREVVGCALPHQRHRGLERGPRGHEQDRQVGIERSNRSEQRDPTLTRGLPIGEVHVLDHQADVLASNQVECRVRPIRAERGQAVRLEQHLQRFAHRVLVVDDQDMECLAL
jgi:hypothetical protein